MARAGQDRDEVPRAPRGPLALALLAIAFACGLALFASLGAWQVHCREPPVPSLEPITFLNSH